MSAMTIAQLVDARIAAKRAEDEAVQARRDIDAQIVELLRDPAQPEGTISTKLEDGRKVKAVFNMNRKVDSAALQSAWGGLSLDVQAIFKWKAEVSVSEMRKIDAQAQLVASKFFETTPGSVTISVEV